MQLTESVTSWIPERTPELETAVGKLPEHLFKREGRYYYPHLIAERADSGKVIISPARNYDLPHEIIPPICASNIIWTKSSLSFIYLGQEYELIANKFKKDKMPL